MTRLIVLGAGLALGLTACGDDGGGSDIDAARVEDGGQLTGDGGSGGGGGGSADGGGAAVDGAPGATDAAATATTDAGPAGVVECGDDTCDLETEECCITGGMGEPVMAACVDTGTCEGAPADCDGPEDCDVEGEVCCIQLGDGGGTISCQAAEACNFAVCHDENDCAEGEMCCPAPIGSSGVCSELCI